MDSLDALAAVAGVELLPAATSEELRAFEKKQGLSLPTSVCSLYEQCNGLTIGPLAVRFLALAEVEELLAGFRQTGITDRWGYFPFLEASDSNPHCVCCDGPILGHVVHVFHDDLARLDFRDLESFIDPS